MALPIRPRTSADLAAVGAMLTATHHSDGYPVILLEDMAAWGSAGGVLAAWVAIDPESGGQVVGHVALTEVEADDEATRQWQVATGLPAGGLAAVRRLVVHDRAHGRGTGAALLATAVHEAHARGLRPVLDMTDNLAAAGRLYERAGFERIGSYDLDLAEGGTTHHLHVLTWIGPQTSHRPGPAPGRPR